VNATSGLLLDSGGNVPAFSRLKQWDLSPSTNVQWQLVGVSNGYYRIMNRTNGMAVDSGGAGNDGATAEQSPWVGSDDQLWRLNPVGNGRYQIINRATGLALDGGGSTQEGASTILWHPNFNTNNEWTINAA
jgi:alpha-L-fucosidase